MKPVNMPITPPAVIRQDGWYWVQIPLWSKDEWSDWTPALWCEEYRSWRTVLFSDVPYSHVRVGERLVKPDTQ